MIREKKIHKNSMEWQYIFILRTKLTFDMVLWFFFSPFRSLDFFPIDCTTHTPYKLLLFAFALSALPYCYLFPINFRLILFRTQSIRLQENKQQHSVFFFILGRLHFKRTPNSILYSPFIFLVFCSFFLSWCYTNTLASLYGRGFFTASHFHLLRVHINSSSVFFLKRRPFSSLSVICIYQLTVMPSSRKLQTLLKMSL